MYFYQVSVKLLPQSWGVTLVAMETGETWSGDRVKLMKPERLQDSPSLHIEDVTNWLITHGARELSTSPDLVRLSCLDIEIVVSAVEGEVCMIECRLGLTRRSSTFLSTWVDFIADWPHEWLLRIIDVSTGEQHSLSQLRAYIVSTNDWRHCAEKYEWSV